MALSIDDVAERGYLKQSRPVMETCRGMSRYSLMFDWHVSGWHGFDDDYSPLRSHILEHIISHGKMVWIDLGCGEEMALREGKMRVKEAGLNPSKLVTYGVDLLGLDRRELTRNARSVSHLELVSEAYAPQRIQANVTDVRFPEPPDLVTAFAVLNGLLTH